LFSSLAWTDSLFTGRDHLSDQHFPGGRQLGHGPGVVLLHGAASSAHNHMQLAEALSRAFTVYVPDRRGRGLSGPYSEDYSIQKEVEDLDALLTKTGANNVFGVSSGGIICLQAALTLPAIHKAAIFEPPFFINDESTPTTVLTRYDQEMAQGKVAAALITGMRRGPSMFTIPSSSVLAECAEELPDVADEQIGDFHGGEMAAAIEL
jgi:pimeloyl-ACP methyl ester carboxylesterase